jgi:acyl-coenzyme A synthetase/AMP-(fatty) acid ligase
METMFILQEMVLVNEDGYYWIMGRVDDVINVAGHRLGTMEVIGFGFSSCRSGGGGS